MVTLLLATCGTVCFSSMDRKRFISQTDRHERTDGLWHGAAWQRVA